MYISFLDHYLIKSFLKINVKWVLENGKTYSKMEKLTRTIDIHQIISKKKK